MAHTVEVGEFAGPLGLLVELVERHEFEVTNISIGAITRDYLASLPDAASVTPEELSEFIAMGARLAHIKSLALLPGSAPEEQAAEILELKRELEAYRAFQRAAGQLLAHQRRTLTRPPRLISPANPAPPSMPMNVSLDMLQEAFGRALRLAPALPEKTILSQHISLETAITRLRKHLAKTTTLQAVIDDCRDRLEVVVTFMGLLELIRGGEVHAVQSGQFGAIQLELARG